MTPDDLLAWAQAHPWLSLAAGAYLLLIGFGNVRLSEETAVRYPRFASGWVFAQKIANVVRGALKPFIGIFLPGAAKEVVSQAFPSAFSAPPTPRNDGGTGQGGA